MGPRAGLDRYGKSRPPRDFFFIVLYSTQAPTSVSDCDNDLRHFQHEVLCIKQEQISQLAVSFAEIVKVVPDICLCLGSVPSENVLSNGTVWWNPCSRAGRDDGDSGDDNRLGVPKSKSELSVVAVASRSPDRPARSQSLYRLSYPTHYQNMLHNQFQPLKPMTVWYLKSFFVVFTDS
jgi:hypothetical protein